MADRILRKSSLFTLAAVGIFLFPQVAEAQRKVVNITFEGNSAFTDSELMALTQVGDRGFFGLGARPRFNVLVLGRDVTYLKAFYRNRGYLQCRVEDDTESTGENGLIVHFAIHEGPLTTLGDLIFSGNELFHDDELAGMVSRLRGIRLRGGDPINESAIQAGAEEIFRRYRSRGHYFATVQPAIGVRDTSSGTAPVHYRIYEGPVVRVSDLTVEGHRSTKKFVITREVTLDIGDLVTEEARRESQRRLYSTGLFRTVGVTVGEVSEDSTSAIILVTVNEMPKHYLGTGLGVAGDQQEQIDLRLHTSAEWGHRNVYGTGRSVELSASADFQVITAWKQIRRELSLRYLEPWFWSSRTPLTAMIALRPRSYDVYQVQEVATEIGLSRDFTARSRVWLNFSYRLVNTEVPIEAFTRSDALRGFNGTMERDSRDNIVSPTRGSLTMLQLSSYGGLLGGPTYSIASAQWSRYELTGSRTVVATRMRVGVAVPTGDTDEVPIFDRFFAGGASSVRGYEERQLGPVSTFYDTTSGRIIYQPRGGEALALFNLEIRRPRYFGPFGLLFFLDAGNIWAKPREMNLKLAFSAGVGVFLDTPIGPVRLDYGWRLNRSPIERAIDDYRLDPGHLHFSVLYAF